MQGRCAALEGQLNEARSGAAAGQRRQAELEFELARAWEELDGAEAARQAEQQRSAAEAGRQADDLQAARDEVAALRGELGASRQEGERLRQQNHQLQAEHAASGSAATERDHQLQQELAAARSALAEQQAQLQAASKREQEAAQQAQQLTASLAAAQRDHEAALAAALQRAEAATTTAAEQHAAALGLAQRERDDARQRLAATEAEFRCALQEAARDSAGMRGDLEALAAECVELRAAAADSQARRQVRGRYRCCARRGYLCSAPPAPWRGALPGAQTAPCQGRRWNRRHVVLRAPACPAAGG